MWKIFLSSTAVDLAAYRDAATQALRRLDGCHCVRMEDFGSRAASALSFCQQKVQECDFLVAIIGGRYGSAPEGSPVSYTEHEYEAAVTKGMPRLIFLSRETLATPGVPEETPAQRAAQERFRARLAKEQIVGYFRTPEELALGVATAISNWLLQNAGEGAEEKEATPSLGPLVAKMCNRARYEADFKLFFQSKLREAPGLPQVCIVRGAESERGDSFTERLIATAVQGYANATFGEQGGAVLTKSVDWPHEGDAETRFRLLCSNVFKELDPEYEYRHTDFSPAALARLCRGHLYPVLVFCHEIRAGRWSEEEPRLWADYMRFWDEFGAIADRKQMLIFLNLIYPEPQPRPWWKALLGGAFDPARVERALLEILNARQASGSAGRAAAPCLLLKELTSVSPDDVMHWFKRHRVFEDMKIWKEHCVRIFGQQERRSMSDVEFALKAVHREFVNSRL